MNKSIRLLVLLLTLTFVTDRVSANVIAYWPFGTNYVYDVSANTNNLQAAGVIFQDGAALLNGNSVSTFSTMRALTLSPYSAITLEFWMKTESADTTQVLFELGNPTSVAGGFQGILNPGDGQTNQVKGAYYTAYDKAYKDYTDTTNSVADGLWHHVAMVVDRNAADNDDRLRLYFDGVLQNTQTFTQAGNPVLKDDTLYIGSRANTTLLGKYDGMLDDIRISDTALTPAQFLQERTTADYSPIAYWPFGTNELNDVAGSNRLAASGVVFTNGAVEMPGNKVVFFDTAKDLNLSEYNALTLEFWLKTSSTAQHPLFEITPDPGANPGAVQVMLNSGTTGQIKANYYVDSGVPYEEWTDTSTSAVNDQWHHVAMVVDRDTTNDSDRVRLYFDNQLQTGESWTQSSNTVFKNGRLYIGSRANGMTAFNKYNGMLDDIRITAAALLPGQFVQQRTTHVAEPRNDLIAYWPFGEHGLEDVSGNSNTLVNQNVVLADEGYALFNGENAFLRTQTTLDRSAYSDVTIECWFKPESEINTSHHIFSCDNIDESGCYYVYLYQNQLWGQLRIGSDWQVEQLDPFQKYTNAWHHLAYVVSGHQLGSYQSQLYVDGMLVHQTLDATDTIESMINQTFWIGTKGEDVGTRLYKGKLDDIRVTGRALAPWEFMKYRSSKAEVLAYWPFRPGAHLLEDASGNGHTLSNINTEFEYGAAVFNGTNTHLRTADMLDLSNQRYLTIECFAQFGDTASPEFGRDIFSMTNNTEAGSLWLYNYDNRLYSQYRATGTGWNLDYLYPLSPLGDGEWHQMAFVIDPLSVGADNARLYVDGTQCASAGGSYNASGINWLPNKTFIIGAREDATGSTGHFFIGKLDDIRIVDRALQPSEFMTLGERTHPSGTVIVIR